MEYFCEYCGKAVTGGKAYCSKSCAGRAKFEGDFDRTLQWKTEDGKWVCPYNEGVSCKRRRCECCGWNPEVAKNRSEKIREAYV